MANTEASLDLGRANRDRPRLEVADIFRAPGPAYRQSHALSPEQLQVMAAIETCRTAALGGHVELCPDCGKHRQISCDSCRNRHGPKCQALAQARWIAQREQRILPTHYFHVVFTLSAALRQRPGDLRDQRRWYGDHQGILESPAATIGSCALVPLAASPRP